MLYNDHRSISIIAYSVARQVTKYKLLCPRSTIAINYIILYCTCKIACRLVCDYKCKFSADKHIGRIT